MAASNPQEYLALVAEMENLKSKFASLELENQRLLEDLQKVSVEKQQIQDEFTRRVQQLESAIVALQQLKVDGQGVLKEPKISLPAKFDGSRAHFRGFINQVRLVIQMHPTRYPTDSSRVGLVGTLLTGTALSWFAPLLESNSPLLNNFDEFIKEFKACFGDTDSVRTAINKIRTLRQGDQPASTYAANFRLIASDIPWDEQALMEQFRSGLRGDVKDLLLTFPEDPKSLTEAISRAIRCDNRLFERRSERQQQQTRSRFTPTYASVTAQSSRQQYSPVPTPRQARSPTPMDRPTPMEIDMTRRRGPLSDEEKQRRRANHLCLYCGGPGHIAIHCPHRPRRQVHHINYDIRNESSIIDNRNESSIVETVPTSVSSDPTLSNKFEVLSQLEEESNE